MPDHRPFDGTVGIVLKMPAYLGPSRWVSHPAVEDPRPLRAFPTWREAMDYAMHDPRPVGCCGVCPPIVGGGYDCTCEGNPRCPGPKEEDQ